MLFSRRLCFLGRFGTPRGAPRKTPQKPQKTAQGKAPAGIGKRIHFEFALFAPVLNFNLRFYLSFYFFCGFLWYFWLAIGCAYLAAACGFWAPKR